jgi:hypothetical protein
MYDVKLSQEFEDRLLDLDDEALAEVVILIELMRDLDIDVISVLDRLYRELICQGDRFGNISWMAFRIYTDRQRVNILVKVEQDGSRILY